MADHYGLFLRFLSLIDAERAHRLTITLLKLGLVPTPPVFSDPALQVRLFGLTFPNPVGLAAGFDKNAEVVDQLLDFGFGFVEVGTVTPRPQAGNARPRLFRLPADAAVINRMGFNNDGAERVGRRLAKRREAGRSGVVGVNVGPNRDAADPAADCVAAAAALAPFADYVVLNVSSPNTPGLRDLQRRASLSALLERVLDARARTASRTPLLVKIAPDTSREERAAIVEVALALAVDGLIATNTTTRRPPELKGRHRAEAGGLSGRPLLPSANEALADLHRFSGGRLPLIGVGGIASGKDALEKLRLGASLVQLYTALVYQGPSLIRTIQRTLAEHFRTQPP